MKASLIVLLFSVASVLGVAQSQSGESRSGYQNSDPTREYGHIEWHGSTALLIAGSGRPLDMTAQTLSSCLGISVSAEDPHYDWTGDVLDLTARESVALHPDHRRYVAKPGKVELSFELGHNGQPIDVTKLLQSAVDQVNQQLPWHYRLQHDVRQGHSFYTFVPTTNHNESGQPQEIDSWLDERITIPSTTAPIQTIADMLAESLTSHTGYHFSCCMAIGGRWGSQTLNYEATDQPARLIFEDLMIATGATSFVQRCEPLDKRWCFISLVGTWNRVNARQSGVCTALGYRPN